jgi:DNA-binding NarL/FixJ family response regulator
LSIEPKDNLQDAQGSDYRLQRDRARPAQHRADDGGYEVVGQTHTSAAAYALAQKHHPHIVCIAREQVEDGNDVVEQLRANCRRP